MACLVQKNVDLRAQFQRIHTLLRASEQTLPISRIETRLEPTRTHLLPIQEKAKHRRRSDAILTRDHRTYPNAQIDL